MRITRALTIAALAALVASPAMAQQKSSRRASLQEQAKISKDSATVIALAKVPAGSQISESELERENGTVVWSFDIKVPGQTGVEEVLVSAIDGSVVSQSHESAAAEKAEAAKEKKEAAAKKP